MSQVPGLRRARQLTASVLPTRAADAYPSLAAGRLRKLGTAGSTGMLPFSGSGDGAIYFRDGKVIYAESDRTPGPAASAYKAYADGLPPLGRIMAVRAVTEPIIDAALELFTAPARQIPAGPASGRGARLGHRGGNAAGRDRPAAAADETAIGRAHTRHGHFT